MTFQRILTYTLNSITKKIVTVLFSDRRPDHETGHAIPDSPADGHCNDRQRFPRDVADDGQRATVPDAKYLAHRQLDDGGRRQWGSACSPFAAVSWP